MLLGSLMVGIHMAMTHGLTLGMVSAYIPNTKVPGLGRVNGTAWSFTDFVFGACCVLRAVDGTVSYHQA